MSRAWQWTPGSSQWFGFQLQAFEGRFDQRKLVRQRVCRWHDKSFAMHRSASIKEMEADEEEDLKKLDKMFEQIDGDGTLVREVLGTSVRHVLRKAAPALLPLEWAHVL